MAFVRRLRWRAGRNLGVGGRAAQVGGRGGSVGAIVQGEDSDGVVGVGVSNCWKGAV